jgi:simple sugar transport system substrate-binding protein
MLVRSLFVALAFLLTASASFGLAQEAPERGDIRVIVVTHGSAADPFWSVVKNGVDQAQADTGVAVEYRAPDTFDMPQMAQLINAAVASAPDALVISIPDSVALGDAVGAAVAAGIPVFSINSGSDVFQELGVLRHVGQTEFEAGLGGGQQAQRLGATRGLCVNHEVGNVALDLRCEGFAEGLGGPVEVLAVGTDPIEVRNAVVAALRDEAIDAVLATGPVGGIPTLDALREVGRAGEIVFGTFDLAPDLLQGAVEGDVSFLIDQQQWLQGYLGVITAVNYVQYGLLPGNEVILTGPGFVTPETASQVIALSARGIR